MKNKKRFSVLFLIIVIIVNMLNLTTVLGHPPISSSWTISRDGSPSSWTWNRINYFVGGLHVTDDGAVYSSWMSQSSFDKLMEYQTAGYDIYYRAVFTADEVSSADLEVYFEGESNPKDEGGVWNDGDNGTFTLYHYQNGVTGSTSPGFYESNHTDRKLTKLEDTKLNVEMSGSGDDEYKLWDVYFEFAIIDDVPPEVESVAYYDDWNDSQPLLIGTEKLSFSGDDNYVDMVVTFDEDIQFEETGADKYIETNMTIGEDGKGSFEYLGKKGKNSIALRYWVSYGDYAREVDREGLVNKHELALINKTQFLSDLEKFKIVDMYGNDFDPTIESNHKYSDVAYLDITLDGDPPEISEVQYDVAHPAGSKGDGRYLNVGDIVYIKVKLGQLLDNEKAYVSSNGYLPLNNDTVAYIDNYTAAGYSKNDWIIYKYVVSENDTNTNSLDHTINASPKSSDYYNQVFNMAKKMGITDDFGNYARMFQTGEDRYATMLFPKVNYQEQNIFIDTIKPKVEFSYTSPDVFNSEQIITVTPVETGSMLSGGKFHYVISKSSNHPTGGIIDDNTLGVKYYMYTRTGDNPNSGYSDISNIKDILINDDLYMGSIGYSQYDERYDFINKTGVYKDINYVNGTATDVIFDGRREITGEFYIHTYMKDLSGNENWQTSHLIKLDNTHMNIKLSPLGTTKYTGDIDIYYEFLQEQHSGYDMYEYRWIMPLAEKNIDMKDMFTSNTDTYNLLRDNHSDWVRGNSLDGYNKSRIPVPEFDTREHGANYLLIRAYDKTGNVSYIVSEPYYFDKKSPVISFESLSGGYINPVENHKARVTVNDEDTILQEYKYYFSNSILTRDIDDPIWKTLSLSLPDLPEDYDPFSDKDYGDLLTKEAFLETKDWKEDTLNGYVFLHVYAKDICGNDVTQVQEFLLDNGGKPVINIKYDNAVDNRYKEVVGHIEVYDNGGIELLEYEWKQSTEKPSTYKKLDITGKDNKNFSIDTLIFKQGGEWYLHVRATDTYGNVTDACSEMYTIIAQAPDIELFNLDIDKKIITNNLYVPVNITKLGDFENEYTYILYSDNECTTEIKRGTFGTSSQLVNINLDMIEGQVQDFYFRFTDSLGFETLGKLKVEAVYDKTPPTANLVYTPDSSEGITSEDVVVTLENIGDNVSVDITSNSTEYTFTQNGEYNFILKDEVGNERIYTAIVNWIAEDTPVVRINTSNVTSEKSKDLKFSLIAQRPSESGYVDIVDPVIYYCITTNDKLTTEEYTKYSGELITYTAEDGEYYIHTKLVDDSREFTGVFGGYILDNTQPTINSIMCTYKDSEGVVKTIAKEDYDKIEEVNGAVTVSLDFDEETKIISVLNSSDNVLPNKQEIVFNKNDNITVKYIDNVGNEGTAQIAISNLAGIDYSMFTITPDIITKEDVKVKITPPEGKVIGEVTYKGQSVEVFETSETITYEGVVGTYYKSVEFIITENGEVNTKFFDVTENKSVSLEGVETVTYEISNEGTIHTYNVTNIDKVLPIGVITEHSIDDFTKKLSIEITDDNEISITKVEFIKTDNTIIELSGESAIEDVIYNSITNDVITNINGTVKYYFKDIANNENTSEKVVNSINASLDMSFVIAKYIVGTSEYSSADEIGVVSQDIIVSLSMPEEYFVVNNSGRKERTFMAGNKYDFLISNGINIDKFSIDLTDKISKVGPSIDSAYTIDGKPYQEELINGRTNKDVLMTITGNNLTKVLFDGVEDNEAPFTYTFEQNKVTQIIAMDSSGNTSTIKASVDFIDKEPVRAGLFSLYTMPTNESNIRLQFLSTKPVDILGIYKENTDYAPVEGGKKVTKYEFNVDDNGTYKVMYEDNLGNTNTVSLTVSNFDRTAPVVKLLYNDSANQTVTKKDVLVEVELVDESSEPYGIEVLNTIGGVNGYLFKENGTFTFRVADIAGNVSEITATVNNIDRTPPSYEIVYSTTKLTKDNVTATVIIGEDDYIIKNKDILNNVNESIEVNGREITVTFDDNGYYKLNISDKAKNGVAILLRVRNIDRIKPTIEFLNPYSVTLKDEIPKLDDFIAFDTHSGDIKNLTTISHLDVTTEGTKTIEYTATDEAGNQTVATREIVVIGDEFTVVVDGKVNPAPFFTEKRETDVKVYNFVENCLIKYLIGENGAVKDGEFKQNGKMFGQYFDTIDDKKLGKANIEFFGDKPGWHTVYVQDQNRNTYSFTIYISRIR